MLVQFVLMSHQYKALRCNGVFVILVRRAIDARFSGVATGAPEKWQAFCIDPGVKVSKAKFLGSEKRLLLFSPVPEIRPAEQRSTRAVARFLRKSAGIRRKN